MEDSDQDPEGTEGPSKVHTGSGSHRKKRKPYTRAEQLAMARLYRQLAGQPRRNTGRYALWLDALELDAAQPQPQLQGRGAPGLDSHWSHYLFGRKAARAREP
mmetsp:Transcript_19505/g.49593  ORF Transcript_19505/g.49593 Transcript_19505/m.49593 type:complete len:103 (-) Transcript_19505:611-919(-)